MENVIVPIPTSLKVKKKALKTLQVLYVAIIVILLYLPVLFIMIESVNSSVSNYGFGEFTFEWYQKNDKTAFRVNPISSFVLGQCLMSPPKWKKKGKIKFYLYNAGGLIFSYSLDVIFMLLFFLIDNVYFKFLLLHPQLYSS